MSEKTQTFEKKDKLCLEETQRDLYLTFHLQDEEYGIGISRVSEILGLQKITKVPDMPREIPGVINLRGHVIPVMDVRLRFGLPGRNYDERTCVIVAEVYGKTTGLVVDRVNEVLEISAEAIESPTARKRVQGYIQGYGKVKEAVIILLDIVALLGEAVETGQNVLEKDECLTEV